MLAAAQNQEINAKIILHILKGREESSISLTDNQFLVSNPFKAQVTQS